MEKRTPTTYTTLDFSATTPTASTVLTLSAIDRRWTTSTPHRQQHRQRQHYRFLPSPAPLPIFYSLYLISFHAEITVEHNPKTNEPKIMSDTASQHHIEIDINEADSKNNDTNAGNENPPSPLSTDVSSPDDAVDSESSSSSSSPPPLYQSSRLKGYITLLISAVYNYIALADINDAYEAEKNASNLCLYIEDLSRFANNIPTEMQSRIRYAKSSALITLIVTGFVISVHLDVCTGLEKKVWKMVRSMCVIYCVSINNTCRPDGFYSLYAFLSVLFFSFSVFFLINYYHQPKIFNDIRCLGEIVGESYLF